MTIVSTAPSRTSPATDRAASDRRARASALLDRGLLGMLVTLVVVAPWVPALVTPLSLLVATLVALVAIDRRRVELPAVLLVAGGIPLSQLISLGGAVDLPHAATLTLVSALGWACAAAMVQIGARSVRIVLSAATASFVLACGYALTGLGDLSSHSGGSVVSGRLQGPFAQPNELGAYVVLLLPVLLAAAVKVRSRQLQAVLWVACLPALAALALSLSRGAWVGTVAAIAALAVLVPRVRAPLAMAGATGLAGLILAAVVQPAGPAGILVERVGSLSDPSRSPDDHRPVIWDLALDLAQAHPLVGIGAGGMETAATDSSSAMSVEPPLHAHDLPLTVLAEGGALGFGVLVALAIAVGVVLLRGVRTPSLDWWVAGPAAAVAGAAIHGIIDVPWRNPILNMTVWVVFGALAASSLARPTPNPSSSTNSERYTVKLFPGRDRRSTPDTSPDAPRTPTGSSAAGSTAAPSTAAPTTAPSAARPAAPSKAATAAQPSAPTTAPQPERQQSSSPAGAGTETGEETPETSRASSLVRELRLPAAFAVLATLALVIGVALVPTQQEASAVIGLRSETVDGIQTSSDELRLIAQQYAVSLSSDGTVDAALEDLGLSAGSATAEVDPDTTTVRITAQADDPDAASRLAAHLVEDAEALAEEDEQAAVVPLADASADSTATTPSRMLLLAAGLAAISVMTLALWLLRRQR